MVSILKKKNEISKFKYTVKLELVKIYSRLNLSTTTTLKAPKSGYCSKGGLWTKVSAQFCCSFSWVGDSIWSLLKGVSNSRGSLTHV